MSKRLNESSVWDHATKIGGGKAQCNLCSKVILCSGGSTSGLKRHQQSAHSTAMTASANATQPLLASFGSASRPCAESRQDKITQLLSKVLIVNMLPLSLVDNVEFIELMACMEPNYKVPCRQTITARLDSMYKTLATTVIEELKETPAVSLTSDIWTSSCNDAYISVTASFINNDWQLVNRTLANEPMEERHMAAHISTRLLNSTKQWGIEDKVKAVVHDGASNMTAAGGTNGWLDVNCAAHKLHLCVTGAMGIDKVTNNQISKCVESASRLVGHFSHSPMASVELEKRQTAMAVAGEDGKPLKLIQHVKTRWNSVYDMFERLVKLR